MKTLVTYRLAVEFYRLVKTVKTETHLKTQLLRAASSIVLNLGEGYGRRTHADRRRHFSIAFGSLRESQAALEIAEVKDEKILDLADHIGGCLYKLCRL